MIPLDENYIIAYLFEVIANARDQIGNLPKPPGGSVLLYIIIFMCVATFVFWMLPLSADHSVVAQVFSWSYFVAMIDLYTFYDPLRGGFQFRYSTPILPELGINLSLGVDTLSLSMLILTTAIFPFCLLACSLSKGNFRQLAFNVFLIEIFLVCTFMTTNLFIFFVFFESVLIPMFIIIGIRGSGERRIKAALYFFLYTLFGSFFFIIRNIYFVWFGGS